MRNLILKALGELNVPTHRILCEVNVPPTDITKTLGYPKDKLAKSPIKCKIEYYRQGRHQSIEITINPAEPLLNGIERAKLEGISVPNACRAGACALCRTKLRSGDIFVPNYVTIREADRQLGFIHPCVAYPISDLHIEIYVP
jgi:glycine betaine catabolism B